MSHQNGGYEHCHIPQSCTTPIPKKLYSLFQVVKCHWSLWGTWREGWGGAWGGVWGWGSPITKIKGFYKKCYKLVSKENPRGAEEGSEEGKGKRGKVRESGLEEVGTVIQSA